MLASGPALSITGGHGDENYLAPQFAASEDGVANGVEGVTAKIREDIKYGADVVKFMATGGVLSEGDNPELAQYSLEARKVVADGLCATAEMVGEERLHDGFEGYVVFRPRETVSLVGIDDIDHRNVLFRHRGDNLVAPGHLAAHVVGTVTDQYRLRDVAGPVQRRARPEQRNPPDAARRRAPRKPRRTTSCSANA